MEIKKIKRRLASGGGRGRRPRSPRIFGTTTGGNPRKRNRKWILKRRSDRAKVIGINKEPAQQLEIECKIFLDTNDDELSKKYYKNFLAVLEEQEFVLSRENPAIKGSWLKDFWVKLKNAATNKEVVDRLEKIERGIELHYIDKVQSEVNVNDSQAIANLLVSTKDIPNISTLVGSLLFAKATVNGEPIFFAQTLTQEQLKIVKDNPSLLTKPFDLINKMEGIKSKVLAENKQKKIAGS